MDSRDAHQITRRVGELRFVTAHFEALQGLAVVPGLAAMTVYLVLPEEAGDRLGGAGWLLLGVCGIALGLLGGAAITRWYRRTYRELDQATERSSGAVVAAVAGLIAAVMLVAAIPAPTISLAAIVAGAAMFAAGWRLRHALGPVLMPAGIALAALGLAPLGGWDGGARHPLSATEPLLAAVCIVWIATAIRSHLVLSRTLRPGH